MTVILFEAVCTSNSLSVTCRCVGKQNKSEPLDMRRWLVDSVDKPSGAVFLSINLSNSQSFCRTFSSKFNFISTIPSPPPKLPDEDAPATTPLRPHTKGLETDDDDVLLDVLRFDIELDVIVVSGTPFRLLIRD